MTKKALPVINPATLGIAITLALALIAELYRFHGVLLIDYWVPIFTFGWLGWQIFTKQLGHSFHIPKVAFPAGLFILLGTASLLINSSGLSSGEFLTSAFYGIRWISMFLLSIIVLNQPKKARRQILWMVFIFAALLSIAGFIQMQLLSDFNETTYELDLGWDPHGGRLLATWFDPNLLGGLFAFTLPLLLGTALEKPTWRKYLIPLGIIILTALALTFSRSSYLALLTGLGVFGLIRSRKLLIAGMVFLLITVTIVPQLQARVQSLIDSAESVFTEDYTLPDQSSRERFEAWENGWKLFAKKPILGHGYNRYKYAALEEELIVDLEKHSASGSDSSLLTILATTGILGFIPFITIYILLALAAWKNRRHGYAAGFLGAFTGLFIHSIFVNSLLFPLFMAPFWLAVGILPPLKCPSNNSK